MENVSRPLASVIAAVAFASLAACSPGASSSGGDKVELSLLVTSAEPFASQTKTLTTAFTEANPDITIKVENSPANASNPIPTRLSTGTMTDVFVTLPGPAIRRWNPAQTLVDLAGDPMLDAVDKTYLKVATEKGKVYSVPISTAMAGGILYSKKVYAQLGLSEPRTWAEFEANNAKIKAAGLTAVIGTYKDAWTSQLLLLGNFHNVAAEDPGFADNLTANKAKFATTPAAMKGWERIAEVHDKGYLNKDFASATVDQGLKMLAEGKGVHYPVLTAVAASLAANYPQQVNDIGFFAQPGDDAATNGATIWMPASAFIAKTTKHVDEAKKFLAFAASEKGIEALNEAGSPTGPYMLTGATLPANAIQVAKDLQGYVDRQAFTPSLEFLMPLAVTSTPNLTVAVGSGLMSPKDAAEAWDKEAATVAKQLGLPW